MVSNSNTRLVRIHIKFIESYLDKLKELISKNTGLEVNEISYAEATLELKNRLDRKGGLKETN